MNGRRGSVRHRVELPVRHSEVEVRRIDNARVARLVLADRRAVDWPPPTDRINGEARRLLQHVNGCWPAQLEVDFLMTFGGFMEFPWPTPEFNTHGPTLGPALWQRMVSAAEREIRRALGTRLINQLGRRARYLTLGIDGSASPERRHRSEPHAELVGMYSFRTGRFLWTGKTYPLANQYAGLIRASVGSHFSTLNGNRCVVLGCHDMTMFNSRGFENAGAERRRWMSVFRDRFQRWRPTVVLHHPHHTDTARSWSQDWKFAFSMLPQAPAIAASGICHDNPNGGPVRQPLGAVLEKTRFMPTIDFVFS